MSDMALVVVGAAGRMGQTLLRAVHDVEGAGERGLQLVDDRTDDVAPLGGRRRSAFGATR